MENRSGARALGEKTGLQRLRNAAPGAGEQILTVAEKISLTMSNTGNSLHGQLCARRGRYVRNQRSRSWPERRPSDLPRREVWINGALQLQRLADAIIENSDEQ